MTDTPEIVAVTVLDDKQRAAKIKHLKDTLVRIGEGLPELKSAERAMNKLKDAAKGYAKDAGVDRYEIEEPSRVVLKWIEPTPNSTKAQLLEALIVVIGDKAEAQSFFDELMSATDTEGKPILKLSDRSGYFSIGDR